TQENTPTAVSGGYTWSSISAGNETTCGLTTTGSGYCWGYNAVGQVGNNTTTEENIPTAVFGNLTFSSIASGSDSTDDSNCGLTTGGLEYCWGYNNVSQVGDRTTTNRTVPAAVL